MCAVVRALRKSALCKTLVLLSLALTLAGCGSSRTMNPTPSPTPSQPSQPNYPSTPPVAITWSPSTSLLPAPPACAPPQQTCAPPYPDGSNNFPLTVSSPTDQSSVTSPMHVVVNTAPKNPLFFMRVYVDQLAVYFTFTNSIDTQILVAPGQHKIEVIAEDKQGYISDTILNVTVTSQTAKTTISGIQNMPGWQSCSAVFPAGSGRDGQLCAAGNANPPTSSMTAGQTSPALDGQSAKFSMSGPNAYANMLYFN